MTHTQALGHLIAGAINTALSETCCTNCCGPCAGLAWYRDNDPDCADAAVKSNMSGPDDGYDWQLPGGGIDWAAFANVWGWSCPFGCNQAESN